MDGAPPRRGPARDLLFIADPLSRLDPETDSTLALASAALGRGHRPWHVTGAEVWFDGAGVRADARKLVASPDGGTLRAGERVSLALSDVAAAMIRVDPPFDEQYHLLTLLLELARHDTVVVNDPRGLREANEKLLVCRFPELAPPLVVTADPEHLLDFAAEREAGAVVKPATGHGGTGVLLLRVGDPNARSIAQSVTRGGAALVMAQEFLPDVYRGDKRILLVDGEPLGAVLRVPRHGDFRANLALGASPSASALDADDDRIVAALAPSLRAEGLWFVGLDVVAGRLTEVNVTSPTGLLQLASLAGGDPAAEVIAALETRIERWAAA